MKSDEVYHLLLSSGPCFHDDEGFAQGEKTERQTRLENLHMHADFQCESGNRNRQTNRKKKGERRKLVYRLFLSAFSVYRR